VRCTLLVGCLVDTLYPAVGRATVRLLERLGHTVDFPPEQTCCGQIHANTGYREPALVLARRVVRTFEGAESVVTPAASCAAMVRHGIPQIAAAAGDDQLARGAAELAPRVYELSQFLTDVLGLTDVGAAYPHRVTYHPTCHAVRTLGVTDQPLRLLGSVRGLQLCPLDDAATCCGFGGTFAVKNPDVSQAMLSDKVAAVLASRAEVVCAVDSSCLMHIGGGLARGRTGVRTAHLAEVLAASDRAR